jgi:hypothetical protein
MDNYQSKLKWNVQKRHFLFCLTRRLIATRMGSYKEETKNHSPELRQLLEQLQHKLREKLLEELWEDRDCLEETVLHPDAYSYKFQTYKEKYLDKLADLQRIWNELVTLEKAKNR